MIYKEHLIKILSAPHFSEKVTNRKNKYNTIVFKIDKNATKSEIKISISKIFNVIVNKVSTLIVKGKSKRYKQKIGYRNDWKKAYVTLEKGQNINIMDNISTLEK